VRATACVALLTLASVWASAARAAELHAIRPVPAADYTRVVFDLGERTTYRLRAEPANPAALVPARLYVDLDNTKLGAGVRTHFSPAGGPMLRWRSIQISSDVTRVILDVPGLSEYRAFPLADPFRLVVVVHGTPRPVPSVPAKGPEIQTVARPRPAPAEPPAVGAATKPSRPFTVVLDPGHGGRDPGAQGVNGVWEKDVVLAVARAAERRLVAAGYQVILTRDRDVFVSLDQRATRANAARADLFVSLHANASPNAPTSGIETYYLSNSNDRATIRLAGMENHLERMAGERVTAADVSWILSDMIQNYKVTESLSFARQIQDGLTGQLRAQYRDVRDLGVKPGPFYVLVGAGMPAVLVELAFLTNEDEARRLAGAAYQEALADGLSRGIQQFAEHGMMASNL